MQNNDKFLGDNIYTKNVDDVKVNADGKVKKSLKKKIENVVDKKKSQNVDLIPNPDYLLIRPIENPFNGAEINEDGLIVSLEDKRTRKNQDTGEQDEVENFISIGEVLHVGKNIEKDYGKSYVSIGDCVYYSRPSQTPIPFLKMGLAVLHGSRVLAVTKLFDADGEK